MQRRKQEFTARFLCAIFCFAMAFSVFFIAAEADHDCTGDRCPVCAEIALCVTLLQTAAAAAAAVIHKIRHYIIDGAPRDYDAGRRTDTLVSLRILLLD